ncbi:MAG: hypothetical protein KAX45_06535 [Chitinophagaceae bacterium]|nr:hypothetical protein [Chitinophagaceae bacterium]MBL0268284.1 hypothetical protein [Chitinophagaceae bacterium]MBP6590921.1 hypothetical protein [Chitinophagaceae bacterium]MBP8244175.1 hypothetical protein [Chitinophagaceae bacterium]
MKTRSIRYHVQSAKIYKNHYQPSYNIFRLLKSVLAVLLHGSSAAASASHQRHK